MASLGGHKGSIPLTRILDIVDRHAYKQRHVAWNMRGVQAGLPPDVVTVMVGTPDEGFHWNLRRGMVPEENIREASGRIEDNEEILESLKRYGFAMPGWQPDSQSMFGQHNLKKEFRARLLYTGWRGMLRSLLMHRRIRDNTETETLLGSKDYRKTILTRKRWDAAMAIEITAD